jgi:hypothetical protein
VEEDEDEDPEVSKTVEAMMSQRGRLDRRSFTGHTHKLGQSPEAELERLWAD